MHCFDTYRKSLGTIAYGFPTAPVMQMGKAVLNWHSPIRINQWRQLSVNKITSNSLVVSTETVPYGWGEFCPLYLKRYGKSTLRTHKFMTWRYQNFPGREFSFLTIYDEMSEVRSTLVCAKRGQYPNPEIWIYDILSDREDDVQDFLSVIHKNNPGASVVLWQNDLPDRNQLLEKLGFTVEASHEMATICLSDSIKAQEMCKSSNWFISLTDSDL
jgi:hypothetical protein